MSDKIGSLRVDRGIRRIEVNEEGECIEVSLNDSAFFEKFAAFLKWLEIQQNEFETWSQQFQETYRQLVIRQDEEEKLNVPALEQLAAKKVELSKGICGRLDQLFGEGCCSKVFGPVVPDENSIAEFLEQLTPILQKLVEERNEKIQLRYDRNRKGARSLQGGAH